MDASLEISLTNDLKKLKICIEYEDDNEHPKSIILNKFDSVKLAKELRRLISMLEV